MLLSDIVRQRREDVVPDRREAAGELRDSRRPGDEPPVKMLASVAPPADVDATELADRSHGTLDARQLDPEIRRQVVRQISGVRVVASRHEQDDQRKAVRICRRHQAPALIRPEELLVRGVAGPAIHAPRARTRLLLGNGRKELAWPELALEGPGVPLIERRHAKCILRALVKLLGRLRHDVAMLTA
jgi:hypothetical protein